MPELVIKEPPCPLAVNLQLHQPINAQHLAPVADRHLVAGPSKSRTAKESFAIRALPNAVGKAQNLSFVDKKFAGCGRGQCGEAFCAKGCGGVAYGSPFEHAVHG